MNKHSLKTWRRTTWATAAAIGLISVPSRAAPGSGIPGWMHAHNQESIAQFRADTHVTAPLVTRPGQLPTITLPVIIGSHRLHASFSFYEGRLHDLDVATSTVDKVPCTEISDYLDELLGPGEPFKGYELYLPGTSNDSDSPSYVPRDSYQWNIPGDNGRGIIILTVFRGQPNCSGFSISTGTG
ncbi:hypothetical protein HZF05_13675 [Sphingomonas sp. CGMCC 1.13654]|uniref:Secreted protein n=1 Tax=Sphingomonas chungangi TaxID=2683589 RepID=A0A838LAI6_9SPHN|nr:hypothetical protein [Sphingomonas chungangi]MBA2935136.1 hypothetical protein [Sphingomonas chungangi]MVW56082.1 hypothetical protein [Sphingomonas chungangi]